LFITIPAENLSKGRADDAGLEREISALPRASFSTLKFTLRYLRNGEENVFFSQDLIPSLKGHKTVSSIIDVVCLPGILLCSKGKK